MSEYLAKIVGLVAEQFEIDDGGLNSETKLRTLKADRLDRAELAISIEAAFDVEVKDEAWGDDTTLEQIAEDVAKARGEAA